ncbi:DUF2786 domain-containing protein [Marinomonas sp. 2405UD66-6]|uniref:DUF2786 domain-containing protein n=1 Tax=Marinomonas sp. 2405UD66-6 TaxID=3391834 RepID=UPI0039C972BD
MSVRRRKKAIQKVVKLLNLATSTNSSESTVALRHAESLIRQYQIAQRELPILQLCDRSTLYRVSWGGAAPRYAKQTSVQTPSEPSVYQRRFSEKNNDPSRAYESARTILDDLEETVDDLFEGELDNAEVESELDANSEVDLTSSESMENEPVLDSEEVVSECAAEANDEVDTVNYSSSGDNVINATEVFRSNNAEFTETLKTQYAASDPNIPFVEDGYWSKVYEKLANFDEVKVQSNIEALNTQLSLAQENLQSKKQKRYEHEQDEVQERAERARIEQSFEEAIERAFQARAKSYEAWEARCTNVRMACLRDEQEAVQGYDAITQDLEKAKESLQQHLQRKEDYRAAKIMHELRRELALAVSVGDEAMSSYEKVISIMSENGLSLKDLEFSDIKNKSLFIRLLERESALIEDVHEREEHTEKMLDKFLVSSSSKKDARPSENPIQRIQRLLIAASEGGQFETQKSLEQVIYLMDSNGVGVRDIGYGFIKKYSVFIRLINWEAERISSLSEREKFTAEILEEYIQHSVQKPKSDNHEQKMSR